MTEPLPEVSLALDDTLRPETTQAPSVTQIPVIEAPESSLLAVDQPDGPSLASTLKLPEPSGQFLSPIPPADKPQHIFSLSDLYDESGGGLETLGPEIASADINVAPDGSFIETSSGPAARELKRRYDQLAGVGPSVRSPYAITAFVSQHGKQIYRIGHRDEHSAPAASAAEVEERVSQSKTSSEASHSPRTKRRSRLSMHFLQPVFAKNNAPPPVRPPTASSTASSTVPKKLRKTRSIPDMPSSEPVITTTPTFSVTGRGHSQSVTAMDNPRPSLSFESYPASRPTDAFADLMDWFNPAASTSSFSASSLLNQGIATDPNRPRVTIQHPFGPHVSFGAPSNPAEPPVERLPAPRLLREMQSFESGLTAKQGDPREDLPASDSPIPSDTSETIHELSRPASAIRLSTLSASTVPDDFSAEEEPASEQSEQEAERREEMAPSSDAIRLSSHYSTEVFNVLQTYRGLPVFEKLVPETQNTTIKLSLAADQSAAPRDDPRFVLWGETLPEPESEGYHSTSRDSLTDLSPSNPSSSSLSISKRRASRASKVKSPEGSSTKLPDLETPSRVLLAATIERWIAQLTSDLNYDELLNFFLTYRTYVSSVDLCHLLICRFHWALQQPSSKQDEIVRRIVRVRTFVAIRYWLLTFFTVDFIPNRELRLLIADWLNTLIHDPILKKHADATDIVRRLIKVAKECKRAHIRADEKPKSNPQPEPASESEDQPVDHVLGKSFAQAIRKLRDDESDLDLDFLPDEAKIEDEVPERLTDPANAHLSAAQAVGPVGVLGPRPSSLPLTSLNILHRTEHAPGPGADDDVPFVPNTGPVHLATRQSVLSRAFVKTISRLGRWKRVLHPRSSAVRAASLAACGVGASAFDIEDVPQDLLAGNGAVEQYLKLIEPPVPKPIPPVNVAPQPLPSVLSPISPPPLPTVPSMTTLPTTPPPAPATGNTFPAQSTASPTASHSVPELETTRALLPESTPLPPLPSSDGTPVPDASPETSDIPVAPVVSLDEVNDPSEEPVAEPSTSSPRSSTDGPDLLSPPDRPQSFRSSSTDSFGVPLTSDGPVPPTFPGKHNPWGFDVVSIDDLDYSDTSSLPGGEDPPHPPGLRRPPRRLPFRRDFEFIRRSEVSSMGIVSHESLRDSFASSNHSESSPTSSGPPPPIHKWQMKSLQQTFESMSDHEDNGDVEAALRRLEGQINPKVEQEKAEKVDGWVRAMQERMVNGDYDYESSLFSEDDVEGFIDEVDPPSTDDTDLESPPELVVPAVTEGEADNESEDGEGLPRTPIPLQTSHQLPPPPGLNPSPPRTELSKQPAIEDVVPVEILQSRMPRPEVQPAPVRPSIDTLVSSKLIGIQARPIHRSFVLQYPAEQLAEHFAMIDRELFMGIKFEELVTEEWMDCQEINVLDWSQYVKDRARWKAELKFSEKTTALAAVRARFNLMVNFVIAEIVLTAPTDRPNIVNKFIRIAWKSYRISNYHTLTAIITALQNEWVTRAMRKPGWGRIGMFEGRMLRDLKQFTTSKDDFIFMRRVVDSIVDAKPLDSSYHSHTPSVVSGSDSQNGKGKAISESRHALPSACIPFIGIYLSQLRRLNKLPALIDPTAPNSVIGIDPVTANFDPPAHPEVFSSLTPLPPSMRLEPLINVHKQRRIADVIKSLVAGQHLASRFQFNVDKKLFQKCLRLRGCQAEVLQSALAA